MIAAPVLITVLIAVGVFAIALTGMAVGVILSNRSIKGSCGGLNNFKDSVGNPICDACTNPKPDCTGKGPRHEAEHCESHPTDAESDEEPVHS
ncbi:hypothetical protein [Blastopirellula marina]|uniref:ApbE family protein n=1 Tax=Blastopirellula marina TaxID=124 RepID=A0A2S8GFB5_9BACT|nr:hypothetical protein [Blastopirellula marina]PQO30099.1 hypothetical protein C5Y98_21340 [Blastopirellula marina]PQO43158.1 hypothetical protein C5Y93_25985 [Blastopirellula marina]PTL42537.1 hypothetical protein C5Y97_21350 [Blastopirellula marina]